MEEKTRKGEEWEILLGDFSLASGRQIWYNGKNK
jgi:hypothetical protein